MNTEDLISIIGLMVGLFLAVVFYILLKQNKVQTKAFPLIFGVGAFIYGFVFMMISTVILRPISEFVSYTIENLFWSFATSIISYFSGHILARRFSDKENK